MRGTFSLIALALIGCASAAPVADKAPLSEPDVRITQTSRVPEVAAHQSGPISVRYRVDLGNRSKENIKVKRIDLQSLGEGAYSLPALTRPFAVELKPGESKFVELWGPAYIIDPTILGANGPVTIRLTVYYNTPAGPTQSVTIRQVHPLGD